MAEKNYYEKSLEKFEKRKRLKLGDEGFLRKYTVRLPKDIKLNRILMPIHIILSALICVMGTVLYFYLDKDAWDLAMAVILGCSALIGCLNIYIFYPQKIKILEKKIAEWKNELEVKFKSALDV